MDGIIMYCVPGVVVSSDCSVDCVLVTNWDYFKVVYMD